MKKLNFSELAQELEVISQEETKKIKGGYWSLMGEAVEVDYYNPIIYWPIEGYTYYSSGDGGYYDGGGGDSGLNYDPSPLATALAWVQLMVDNHLPYRQEAGSLRTANTPAALAYMDCSELVSRYFVKLGLFAPDQAMNTLALLNYARNNPNMLQKVSDDSPQTGDIFLWHRSPTDGHTGIVKSYNANSGMVTILEEYSWGDVHEAREVEYALNGKSLIGHDGWEGFYRPDTN